MPPRSGETYRSHAERGIEKPRKPIWPDAVRIHMRGLDLSGPGRRVDNRTRARGVMNHATTWVFRQTHAGGQRVFRQPRKETAKCARSHDLGASLDIPSKIHYLETMMNPAYHRGTALLLSAVFCLFTIGVPIVVASCPMVTKGIQPCCNEKPAGSGSRLVTEKNTSCCRTVLAGERNLVEFLTVNSHAGFVSLCAALPIQLDAADLCGDQALQSARSPSPPIGGSLRVLTSSLLL